MKNNRLAHCGLDCSACEAYQATVDNDSEKKAAIATKWSNQYGVTFKADDIKCMGCQSDGPVLNHCTTCEIRGCSSQKGYENCSQCSDFSCENLEKVFAHDSSAKKRLLDLR